MINKFDVKPAPEFTGSPIKWIEGIIPIVLSNVMEFKFEMHKKELDLKRIIIHGNRQVLQFFFPKEKLVADPSLPRIEKKLVLDNITNKVLVELVFETEQSKEDKKDAYFIEWSTRKKAVVKHEIVLENLIWKEVE